MPGIANFSCPVEGYSVSDGIHRHVVGAIVPVVRAQQHTSIPLWATLGGLGTFLFLRFYVVRPLLRRFETLFNQRGQLNENVIAVMVIVAPVQAVITEYLGLHLLFGSLLAGATMLKDPKFVRYVLDKFETPTVVLLLPLYFAFTGLRTSIRLISGPGMWALCVAIILVAIIGKLGGSMIAARAAGTRWRESAGLGILMNT